MALDHKIVSGRRRDSTQLLRIDLGLEHHVRKGVKMGTVEEMAINSMAIPAVPRIQNTRFSNGIRDLAAPFRETPMQNVNSPKSQARLPSTSLFDYNPWIIILSIPQICLGAGLLPAPEAFQKASGPSHKASVVRTRSSLLE